MTILVTQRHSKIQSAKILLILFPGSMGLLSKGYKAASYNSMIKSIKDLSLNCRKEVEKDHRNLTQVLVQSGNPLKNRNRVRIVLMERSKLKRKQSSKR